MMMTDEELDMLLADTERVERLGAIIEELVRRAAERGVSMVEFLKSIAKEGDQ